jgi:hypothetical protein
MAVAAWHRRCDVQRIRAWDPCGFASAHVSVEKEVTFYLRLIVGSGPDPEWLSLATLPAIPSLSPLAKKKAQGRHVALLERGAYYMRIGQIALHRAAKYGLENHDVVSTSDVQRVV